MHSQLSRDNWKKRKEDGDCLDDGEQDILHCLGRIYPAVVLWVRI